MSLADRAPSFTGEQSMAYFIGLFPVLWLAAVAQEVFNETGTAIFLTIVAVYGLPGFYVVALLAGDYITHRVPAGGETP